MRDSAPKIKEVEQREKVLLCTRYFQMEKTVSAHAQSVSVTDVELGIDLILAWASMFTAPDDISRKTICPPHCSSVDIGWQNGSHRCRVPKILSSHVHGKPRKADCGPESKTIFVWLTRSV